MSDISRRLSSGLVLALALLGSEVVIANGQGNDQLTALDASGVVRTVTASGTIDTTNAFFQSLGTNGRSCNTCHRMNEAWTITPADMQARFVVTSGTDPVFRTVDGSNSPQADVSSLTARKRAYSMLLNKAVLRIGMPIPANAEFSLAAVDDPYGYASANELSLFRRPLPSTNLRFLSGVMWDARETHAPFLPPMDAGVDTSDLVASFKHQAMDAVLTHAQGTTAPSDATLSSIVAFEMGLTTAQSIDLRAGSLSDDGAIGGPQILANQNFYVGINDVLGADPTLQPFNASSMMLFDEWVPLFGNGTGDPRASIARGQKLFDSKAISITGVGGLNDALGIATIAGTCTTCHDSPNVGNHSVGLPINIGVSDATQRTPDMPLYTLRKNSTGETVMTTDPGRALLTGKWADIGKFKGPVLRGLAARPPYFHNGMAATLNDVVNFYDTRFNIGFTLQEKRDLAAFLNTL
jgi:cytochrome c peroxidase